MSLIENLEGPGWKEFLGGVFAFTLDVMEVDPHRWAGSSVDDLRAWLRGGGLTRARQRLDEQAKLRGFSDEHRTELAVAFDELVARHRPRLVRLAVRGLLAAPGVETRSPPALPQGVEVEDCMVRISLGERPLDASMREGGRSEADIAAVYEVVDAWLAAVLSGAPRAN